MSTTQITVLPPNPPQEQALTYLPLKGDLQEAISSNEALRWIAEEIGISQSLQSDLTKRDYLRSLRRYMERNDYQIPTVRIVELYLENLKREGLSLRYRRRELAAIRWWANRMLLFLAERPDTAPDTRKYIFDNAEKVAAMPDPKGSVPKPGKTGHMISLEEFAQLLQSCTQDQRLAGLRDRAMFAVTGLAGLRIGDARNIQVDNVKKTGMAYRLSVVTKGDKIREVPPITGSAALYLQEWLSARGDLPGYLFCPIWSKGKIEHIVHSKDANGQDYHRRLSREALRLIFIERFKQAGIYKSPTSTMGSNGAVKEKRGSTWHDFRRTLVSRLLDQSHDLVQVSRFIDHAQINTTAGYDIRSSEAIDKMAEDQAQSLDGLLK